VSARIRLHVRAHNLRNEIKTSVTLSAAVLTQLSTLIRSGAGASAKIQACFPWPWPKLSFSAIPRVVAIPGASGRMRNSKMRRESAERTRLELDYENARDPEDFIISSIDKHQSTMRPMMSEARERNEYIREGKNIYVAARSCVYTTIN
jgi:hypothetical protein